MLKLKDNVDFKKLEELGFKLLVEKDKEYYKKIIYNASYARGYERYGDIIILPYSRKISLIVNHNEDYRIGETPFDTLDYLYDLIEADLVEKV